MGGGVVRGVCGCVRLCAVVRGCARLCVVVRGCARLCVVVCGCVWRWVVGCGNVEVEGDSWWVVLCGGCYVVRGAMRWEVGGVRGWVVVLCIV